MRTTCALGASAAMALAGTASAIPAWSYYLDGDAGLLALTNNGALERAVTEGRIGNGAMTGTWEQAIWELGGQGTPEVEAQLAITNGTAVPFEITWDGVDTVSYSVGSQTIAWTDVAGSFTDIFIRARGGATSTMSLTDLDLLGSGLSIGDLHTTNGVEYIRIRNMGMPFGAFTLTGVQTFSWSGQAPTGSQLAYQVKLTNVIPAPATLAGLGVLALGAARRRRA